MCFQAELKFSVTLSLGFNIVDLTYNKHNS